MTFKLLIASLALLPSLACAQFQYTKPGVDSTHIHGIAQRVMPEFSGGGVGGGATPPPSTPQAPTSISDLLARMVGLYVDFPQLGYTYMFFENRVDVAQGTMHGQVNVICSMTEFNSACAPGNQAGASYLTARGINFRGLSCPPNMSGRFDGDGQYFWDDYLSDGGAPQGGNLYMSTMKRAYVINECREEASG